MNAELLWWFALGLLLGWLIEWLIDRAYWRRRLRDMERAAQLRAADAARASAELNAALARADGLEAARARSAADATRLAAELQAAAARVSELEAAQAAGVDQVTLLAAELETTRASAARQATANSADGGAEVAGLRARIAEQDALLAAHGDALVERNGLIKRHQQRESELMRAIAVLRESLARQRAELAEAEEAARALQREAGLAGELHSLAVGGAAVPEQKPLGIALVAMAAGLAEQRREREQLRAELARERSLRPDAALPGGDPLIDIDGIGPVYQQRLYDAGVRSFARLATMSPQELEAIVRPEGWQQVAFEAWIAEARARAATVRRERDPLIDIHGIGPIYAEKLFAAGVNTFAEVAALTPARLREIVGAQDWQQIDADAWIAEARDLAVQVRAGTYRKGVV